MESIVDYKPSPEEIEALRKEEETRYEMNKVLRLLPSLNYFPPYTATRPRFRLGRYATAGRADAGRGVLWAWRSGRRRQARGAPSASEPDRGSQSSE